MLIYRNHFSQLKIKHLAMSQGFAIVAFCSFNAHATSQLGNMVASGEQAEQLTQTDQQDAPEIVDQPKSVWFDKTEQYLAETINNVGIYVDHKLTKSDAESDADELNKSHLKIKLKAEYSHLGYFDPKERINARLHLPNVRKNWKIIFETDPNDYDTLEAKQRGLESVGVENPTKGSIGGIRLEEKLFKHWRTNLDLGVKLRASLDPFTRAQLWRVVDINDEQTFRVKQQVFHYHSIGTGYKSELEFYYDAFENNDNFFKYGISGQYLYEDRGWELLSQLTYYDKMGPEGLMEYSMGISASPKDDDPISNYWLTATWHKSIYKDWLFFSLSPQLEWPREFDYQFNPGIVLGLEAFFSKNSSRGYLNRSIPKSTTRY
ncbi:hypothetical protein ACWU4D_08905 [Vibrio sp. WJH972]